MADNEGSDPMTTIHQCECVTCKATRNVEAALAAMKAALHAGVTAYRDAKAAK